MNTWDYDRATCDAPEEDASDTEGAGASGISTQLIVGNSKGANALSYRRLIFSQDGRLRPAYSEKNKYGHGIFSYSEFHTAADADEYVAPTRCVGYWWSSLYDDAAGTGYSTGSKRHPTVTVPGAKKDQSTPKDADSPSDIARQHTFDVVDGVTVVSNRDQWPPLIAPQPFPCDQPELGGVSFPLVSAYRRMHRMKCPIEPPPPNAVLAKNIARRSRMSIQDILRIETRVVKSCITVSIDNGEMASHAVSAADGVGNLTISSLWSTIQSARFLGATEEACRACLTSESLKAAIRRLEEVDYLRVIFSSDGELVIKLLKPLSSIIRARKEKQIRREQLLSEQKTPVGAETASSFVDPLLGTPFFWAPSGEKERICEDTACDSQTQDISSKPESEGMDVVAGEVPAAPKKKSLVYGSVRPPLKLRKLLKQYYCTTKVDK